MAPVDRESAEYQAGRRDLALELAERAKPPTIEEIKRMDAETINRRWSEVAAVLEDRS